MSAVGMATIRPCSSMVPRSTLSTAESERAATPGTTMTRASSMPTPTAEAMIGMPFGPMVRASIFASGAEMTRSTSV